MSQPNKLTDEEKRILHHDLDIAPENDITGDVGVAITHAEQILKRWQEDIEKAVSEGEQYKVYTNICMPQAKTEAERIALTLVQFCRVAYNSLPKSLPEKSQEKRGEEITRKIVASTHIAEAVEVVTYLNDSDNNSATDSSSSGSVGESVSGLAVKKSSTTWTVILKNEQEISVTNNDLMDPTQFSVRQKCLPDDLNVNERKNSLQNRKEHKCLKSFKRRKTFMRKQRNNYAS